MRSILPSQPVTVKPYHLKIFLDLVKSNILSRVEIEENGECGYQPVCDIKMLTLQNVIDEPGKKA
jgi:hypothetical protein